MTFVYIYCLTRGLVMFRMCKVTARTYRIQGRYVPFSTIVILSYCWTSVELKKE